MLEQITMDVYIDKNKNIILAPYKECEAGYGVVVEPVMYIERQEWNNISQYILDLLSEILKDPVTEETESTVFEKICGNRGFKQFSRKHICITVDQKFSDNKIIISHCPRVSDGSYGAEKGTISEKYSIKYVSEAEKDLVQENFLKAYLDAQRYPETIGSKLL